MQRQDRPVNLDLTQFKFPLTAIVSITHRITGMLLFAGFPVVLYALDRALASEAGFAEMQACFDTIPGKLVLWVLLASLAYHFVAGIKHMLMDFGYFEDSTTATLASGLTFVVTGLLTILAGVWIW